MSKPKDYCTCFFEGCWSGCCWKHDNDCLLAFEYQSYAMRLQADINLGKCVMKKGHPVIAWIMFIGVRLWAEIVWRYWHGIK